MIWRLARGTFLKAFAALFLALPMRDGLAAQKAVSAADRRAGIIRFLTANGLVAADNTASRLFAEAVASDAFSELNEDDALAVWQGLGRLARKTPDLSHSPFAVCWLATAFDETRSLAERTAALAALAAKVGDGRGADLRRYVLERSAGLIERRTDLSSAFHFAAKGVAALDSEAVGCALPLFAAFGDLQSPDFLPAIERTVPAAAARKGVFALMGGFGDHFSYKVRRAEDSIPPMRLAGIADAAAAAFDRGLSALPDALAALTALYELAWVRGEGKAEADLRLQAARACCPDDLELWRRYLQYEYAPEYGAHDRQDLWPEVEAALRGADSPDLKALPLLAGRRLRRLTDPIEDVAAYYRSRTNEARRVCTACRAVLADSRSPLKYRLPALWRLPEIEWLIGERAAAARDWAAAKLRPEWELLPIKTLLMSREAFAALEGVEIESHPLPAGYFDLKFGIGRSKYGFFCPPLVIRFTDTARFPIVASRSSGVGFIEVENGLSMRLRTFRRGDDEFPCREFRLWPGAALTDVDYIAFRRHGVDVFECLPDGARQASQFDAQMRLLHRESKLTRTEGPREYVRTVVGERVEESVYETHGDIRRAIYESRGTGANRWWAVRSYVWDGPCAGSAISYLDSSGCWEITEWGIVKHRDRKGHRSELPNPVVLSRLTPLDGARAVTNAEGRVIGFLGKARLERASYEAVDSNEVDTVAFSPRCEIVSAVTADGVTNELSRLYRASRRTESGKGEVEQWEIEEEARPGRPYGDPENHRRARHEVRTDSGNCVYSEETDGKTMKVYAGNIIPGDRARSYEEFYLTTVDEPQGRPYQTVIEREVSGEGERNVLRRERWILLPEGDRELLSWREYSYDQDGNLQTTVDSNGLRTERNWVRGNEIRSVDDDGVVRNYEYDAIGRFVRAESPHFDLNYRYDLGSALTNAYGSMLNQPFDLAMRYDDAGRLNQLVATNLTGRQVMTDEGGVIRSTSNGRLVSSVVSSNGEETVYWGPKGLDSPRWSSWSWHEDGGFSVRKTPRIGGGVLVITNRLSREGSGAAAPPLYETRYSKEKGVWWREISHYRPEGTNRVYSGGERYRVSGRMRDGAEISECLDRHRNVTRRFCYRDPVHATKTEVIKFPTAEREMIIVSSNALPVFVVSPSGATNFCNQADVARVRVTNAWQFAYDDYGDVTQAVRRVGNARVRKVAFVRDEATGLILRRVEDGRTVDYGYDCSNRLVSIGGVILADYTFARTNGLAFVRDRFDRVVGYSVGGVEKLRRTFDPQTGRVASYVVVGLGEVKVRYRAGSDDVEALDYSDGVSVGAEEDGRDDDDWTVDDLSLPPLAEDPAVYRLDGDSLGPPLARRGVDGKLRWCREEGKK